MARKLVFLFVIALWLPEELLGQADTERARTILDQGVADSRDSTREQAVQALGLLVNDERARRLAESSLVDSSADVRAAAATSLGQIGLGASIPKLKEAVKDTESEVVFSATSALFVLGDPSAYQVYYAVLTGQRKSGDTLLESQLEMLQDPQALARISFEAGMGFVPFGGAGYRMVRAFTRDKVSPVRAAAAQKLATDPDPKSGEALAKAASDEEWLVRASAVSAIAKRGDPNLLSALLPLLNDDEATVRFTAAAAVVQLPHQEASAGSF